MIVDGHCHAGKGDGLSGPWDTDASLDRYERRARRAGIGRTVLLPAFHSDYRRANRALASIVASDPARWLGFAMVHPVRDAGRVRPMIEEAVRGFGFRGIKVHRQDGRITREICEVARALRVPVLYDVMGETEVVELVAREYPDVAFVIPHLGSFSDDWRAHVAVLDQLVRFPNVHADTSGVRRFDYLAEAIRRAGPDKVIFGSDGPWLHPGVELTKVRLLGLAPEDEAKVLGGNLLRLIARGAADARGSISAAAAGRRSSAPPLAAAGAPGR